MTVALVNVSGKGIAQGITIHVKAAPLNEVLQEIQQQSSYSFIYTKEDLPLSSPITIDVTNGTIDDVLRLCFENQHVNYRISNQYVILTPAKTKNNNKQQGNSQVADTSILRGKIVDLNGNPVAGASIQVKASSNTAIAGDEGDFYIENVGNNGILRISSIGFESQEIERAGKSYILVHLKKQLGKLDETVVIAYGKTTNRLNTGAITRISSADIERQPVGNVLATLQGRVPGLLVTQNSGIPGSNFSIMLRGRNSIQNGTSPLYVIDGVPYLGDVNRPNGITLFTINSIFNSLNPEDIESIEVLKDADATAIYGSRGANGVILITTKKGSSGKTKLDFNYYTGFGKVATKYKFMQTPEYLQVRREAFINDGVEPTTRNASDLLAWDTTRYTDFQKLLLGNTSNITNAHLRLSGGNTYNNFSIGGTYYKETTVYPGNFGDQKMSLDFNFSHSSENKRLNISITSSYTYDKDRLPSMDLSYYSILPPNTPKLYDSLGHLNWQENNTSFTNPLAYLLQPYTSKSDRLTSNGMLTYKITDHFQAKVNTGYNFVTINEKSQIPIASQNPANNPTGSATFGTNQYKNWDIEPQLEFNNKSLALGKLDILLGATLFGSKNNGMQISGTGYTNDALLNAVSGAASLTPTNSFNEYKYEGLFSRINYNWNDKYLVNLTIRRDGSSRFGTASQFETFGAAGLAWLFTEEPFIKNKIHVISHGKIRLSYGITGNDQISDYQYLDTWTLNSYPYAGLSNLRPTKLANPNYHWERNKKLEAGLEMGLNKERFQLTVDWFRNISDNQIIRYTLPSQTGFSNVLLNFPGKIGNTGLELSFESYNIRHRNFTWNTSLNLTFSKNKLLAFPGLASSSYSSSYRIGEPLSVMLGYRFTGVDPETGIYQFEDTNKDGSLNSDDYQILGTKDPVYFGGLGNEIGYKHWDLNFFFYFIKQKGLNPAYNQNAPTGNKTNQLAFLSGNWKMPGDISPYQRSTQQLGSEAYTAASEYVSQSTATLTDASFIRLKNVSLAYSFTTKAIKRAGLSATSIYFEGQNLLTITSYKGLDPETQNIQALPPIRILSFGIKGTF